MPRGTRMICPACGFREIDTEHESACGLCREERFLPMGNLTVFNHLRREFAEAITRLESDPRSLAIARQIVTGKAHLQVRWELSKVSVSVSVSVRPVRGG